MKISKIAYATDFSEDAREAGRHAIQMARHSGAEVVFVHAHPLSAAQETAPERRFGREPFREVLMKAVTEVHDRLTEERTGLGEGGTRTSQSLVDNPVEKGVERAVSELGCQLVVVGSHGRTGAKRLFLGSVAEKIARTQDVPVLVARGDAPNAGYRRVLIPVDHTTISPRQISDALALAAPDAEIVLLHCWTVPWAAYGAFAEQGAAMAEWSQDCMLDAKEANKKLLAAHAGASQKFSQVVVDAHPAPGIQEYLLANGPFDLVVVGHHGRHPFARAFLGSAAEYTLRHSPCSVLVTRAGKDD